jgi:hypothetical protein
VLQGLLPGVTLPHDKRNPASSVPRQFMKFAGGGRSWPACGFVLGRVPGSPLFSCELREDTLQDPPETA